MLCRVVWGRPKPETAADGTSVRPEGFTLKYHTLIKIGQTSPTRLSVLIGFGGYFFRPYIIFGFVGTEHSSGGPRQAAPANARQRGHQKVSPFRLCFLHPVRPNGPIPPFGELKRGLARA